MPSKTWKQQRAMQAAAHGKSTLGIPASVGKEFVQADKGKARKKKPGQFSLRREGRK